MNITKSELKKVQRRSNKAYEDGREWSMAMDELYDFALPNRAPINSVTQKGKTRNRHKAHDATAAKAAHRFAGRLARDLTPAFQKFFTVKLGPAARAQVVAQSGEASDDLLKAIDQQLEGVSKQVSALFERANFALASEEMYLDLFGGQGAMLMPDDEDEILAFVTVPAGQIALREDGRGRVKGVYWKKAYHAGDLLDEEWHDPQFSTDLKKKIEEQPDSEVEIVQASEYDRKTKKWSFVVFEQGKVETDGAISARFDYTSAIWLTPRFYKVPGEAQGRGPGLMALPTIKTLDKVTELTLKAAAFAILGLWIYRNDRAFNPRTARMTPGNMWQVNSTGGPLGPSVQRLEMPGRYDVSNIILQDLREQVKLITFDDALPPDSGAVKSATEIVERLRRLQTDLSGAYSRLVLEIVIPLVKRAIDALQRRDLINLGKLPLDQLALKIEVTSPLAQAQQTQDISNIVNWLQIMLSTGGPEMMLLSAKVEDIFAVIGEKLGVSADLIRGKTDRKIIQQRVAELIAASQLQAAPGAAANDAGPAAGAGGPIQAAA